MKSMTQNGLNGILSKRGGIHVFGIREDLDLLVLKAKELSTERNPISVDSSKWAILLEEYISRTIDSRLKWVTHRKGMSDIVAPVFPAYKEARELQDWFEDNFLDELEVKESLHALLDNVEPWDFWIVETIDASSIAVIYHGDFRIYDWERRMEFGDWPIPHSGDS